MNKEPILVIMAAGMGSRYGGLKQMDPVGPHGELIIDYSLYDAKRAGFRRVIFLIKPQIEKDFKELIGCRIEKQFEVRYAFQTPAGLPQGYQTPAERVKPWGTGHAVLCCKELIDAPFCVINADDYYGVDAFKTIYDTLRILRDDEKKRYVMVSYQLENTLTENGYVARGVCVTDDRKSLVTINERTHIIKTIEGALYTEDGQVYRRIPEGSPVSMNMWGFTPSILEALEKGFSPFLDQALRENPLKAEYFLPTVVGELIAQKEAQVTVLSSKDRWYGVTYKEDKPVVMAALREMSAQGLYPQTLWGE